MPLPPGSRGPHREFPDGNSPTKPVGSKVALPIDALKVFRCADGININRMAVGEAEQRRRCNKPLAAAKLAALLWLEANGGTFYIAKAAQDYHEHVGELVRRHGGVIATSSSSGITVRRYRGTSASAQRLRRPRRRGAGRPRAQASRSSAKSGDSGDDGSGSSTPSLRSRTGVAA